MAGEIRKFYEFGRFRFDAETHCLKVGDELVQLPPKALEALGVLLENSGDIVTRETLLDAVWEESYVDDANLTVAVSTLRKTFAGFDGGENYIQTIARKGYRFTADVEERLETRDDPIIVSRHSQEDLNITLNDDQLSTAKRTKYFRLALILTFAVVAIGAVFAYRNWESKQLTAPEIKTIAVLPFEDISEGPTEKYLGVSLADALAKQFGGLNRITVRPIQAVLKYANRRSDTQTIGRELQVDAVLDGRIQLVGDRLRVSVHLIRTSDNTTVWTESFDDGFTNFFAVQDSISRKIASLLQVQIDEKERRRFEQRGTANAEAYQAYLRGRYFWNKRTAESFQKAIGEFEQAAQKDPGYALAYTGLADCYQLQAEYGVTSPKEAFPKAKEAAKKALELDGDLAEAHTSLAYTLAFYDWDWPGAENSFKRALALNPNYTTAQQWYAEYLVVLGRFDEANTHIDRALQIDPVSPILLTDKAAIHYVQGSYDQSIEHAKRVLEIDPNFAYGYYYLGTGYLRKGMQPEAADAFTRMSTLFGEPSDCIAELNYALAKQGFDGYIKKRVEQMETRLHLKNMPAFNKAFVYIHAGDNDAALKMLNVSYERRERLIINSKYAPDFEPLRQDPRFQQLVKQMGL